MFMHLAVHIVENNKRLEREQGKESLQDFQTWDFYNSALLSYPIINKTYKLGNANTV